jgi:HEAT repeat protein
MRIAAIRSIVALELKKYNPKICKIAATEQEELPLRIAAIDAIGNLRVETFEKNLEALRFSKERLLSIAASSALKRLHPLTSVVPADKFSVSTLRVALTSKHAQVRNEAAIELRKFGAEAHLALPEICSALMSTDQNTSDFEVSVYLEIIRSFGFKGSAASATVCSILNERAPVLAGKDKNTLNRIRAYALVTLADIGVPESAYGYIAEALENSDTSMQLNFAAGAYAVSKLGSKGTVFLPFLLRALNPDFGNTRLSLKSYNAGVEEASYTSARIEAIQALAGLGSSAAGSLSLLESLAKATPPKNCPLTQAAAISAISKIKGAQP